VRDVQAGAAEKRRLMLKGVWGTFWGSSMRGLKNEVRGIIIVFIRGDSI